MLVIKRMLQIINFSHRKVDDRFPQFALYLPGIRNSIHFFQIGGNMPDDVIKPFIITCCQFLHRIRKVFLRFLIPGKDDPLVLINKLTQVFIKPHTLSPLSGMKSIRFTPHISLQQAVCRNK